MRPFHQGQLDFFCGIYAVINALDFLYGLPLARSREIFADTLEELSAQPDLWQATLRNHTDFYWLPPYVLSRARERYSYGLTVIRPFPGPDFNGTPGTEDALPPSCLDLESATRLRDGYDCVGLGRDELWRHLAGWFATRPGKRAAILRFQRFLPYSQDPIVLHWTVGEAMRGQELLFRDASRDPGAIFSLYRDSTDISARPGVRKHLLVLEPPSILLLERSE
ncbi:hypothetical protein LJC23_05530 [Desulfovibrio sp. OttesenSCG-928-I05]|nr:hypothetical protein [Desulfovibrio sp. OttesenSCG-928-I05]